MKTIIRIFILFLLSQNLSAQSPKYEVRAVWLTTLQGLDWPKTTNPDQQRRDLIRILDQYQQANINTVLFQTRVRGTTTYPSAIEPWEPSLSTTPGKSPGYDPLQFVIDECHKRGMECHAWIVTIPIGKTSSYGCKLLRQKFPNRIVRIGDEFYMNPEMPETGDYIASICREVTRRYDIDGIHLDYIRYPETWKYTKLTRQQARQNITSVVRKIHHAVKAEKPWVKMSCSPVGKFTDLSRYKSGGWNAYNAVCQDAQGWLRDGLMDELFPMMYFQGNNFYPFLVDWNEHSYGRIIAPGLSIYMLHPNEKNWSLDVIRREMNVLREENLGITFFRSKFLTDNVKGIYTFTQDFNSTLSLIPPMKWTGKPAPLAATRLDVKRGMTADQLAWSGARDNSGANYLLYNVYVSDSYPVDIDDASNLLVARQRETVLSVPHKGRTLYYAVTAVDRYGNESAPIQSNLSSDKPHRQVDFRQLIMGNSPKSLTLHPTIK
ncbi:MAG: family 10 glycosylhydrolase [Prevotella sp.]|nr:family 10 glycosylhydrolase [Prevotella sp.]